MQPAGSSDVSLASHQRGPVIVHVNPDAAGELDVDGIFDLPSALGNLGGGTSRQKGRQTWWRWRPEWSDVPLHVRQYVHGGVLGPLLGTTFASGTRMVDELRTAVYAHRAGVPTPRPLAVRIERAWGAFVRAHFVCECLPDAADMLAVCEAAAGGRSVPRRAVARSAGMAVARLHEAGIEHADLNLRNILVDRPFDEPQAHVIDFDCARVHGRLSAEQRTGALLRLDRSARKWPASRAAAGLTDRVCLLRSYARGCAGAGPDWRALVRTGRPQPELRRSRHD
jgi:3-deoxy-D-manno-octulosonic acid kinase